ncbi:MULTISPECIES: prephenate dehydratase [unclassified Undibacterium]|uniref:prephenate dehydratase n=2 Tax=Pseudomonadota TaxID=1224 RepID=UPI002AC8B6D5|nr:MULTISPECIES: prephenate dehydratase [unclassified Undibacterium]MEB0139554.1 prephenate dehydratase [Undibacterium sp. CCC2.1]MEB0172515.1 prephenate dehydratase [Undibacterium sp. CCC1.1]MEB0176533.1 prephenate dehydratase [Undibacterium sp. CCC3.4]MEB0215613.1 prephenate dehydratase [Undibacterium sp. 5I2]WPX43989.1 prephenate dehydratase [Undibacterium sp. CCC3.4]
MSDNKLLPLRHQIDAIDTQILDLLNARARVAEQVGHVKAETNAPVFRPEREAQVLRSVAERNPGPLLSADIQLIFREIMSACRALERRVVVAFLGPIGTFSEQAVYQQFGHAIEALPCVSIDEVFRATEAGTADFGVVPIENSTEGAVNRTLDLLLQTSLIISGELAIPVQHSLMSKSGGMAGVTRICAHSQALAQCQTWLNQHYPQIERQAVASNAEAARMASGDAGVAAIAGEIAGQQYALGIVSTHIQDDPHNRTRFAVIGRLQTTPSGKDQTSIVLATPNKAGAVYKLLAPLEVHGVSMTRFESRPARTGNWEYYFYVDVEGHVQEAKVAAAMAELKDQAAFFKVLGSYPCTL